jgi:signal transduction histidine kinase
LIKENGMDLPENNSQPNLQAGSSSEAKSKDLPSRKEIFICIIDTGKGISSTIIPKLFGKFITDSDYGTGLGLYITKKLVEAHGGRIWAYNNNDGIGSTFIFSLPRFDDTKDDIYSLYIV